MHNKRKETRRSLLHGKKLHNTEATKSHKKSDLGKKFPVSADQGARGGRQRDVRPPPPSPTHRSKQGKARQRKRVHWVAHLPVALDGQRHLALGHADGAEADEIRVLVDLEIGRAVVPLAGDGRLVGAGGGAVPAVEPAAEAVDDRASSAHAPSPARPTALARTPARLAIYHHQSTGSKLLSSRVPSLLYSLGAVSHCSYSRTLVSLPRRAVPVQSPGQ